MFHSWRKILENILNIILFLFQNIHHLTFDSKADSDIVEMHPHRATDQIKAVDYVSCIGPYSCTFQIWRHQSCRWLSDLISPDKKCRISGQPTDWEILPSIFLPIFFLFCPIFYPFSDHFSISMLVVVNMIVLRSRPLF